jgi:ActR/RegA family two-component response regulator
VTERLAQFVAGDLEAAIIDVGLPHREGGRVSEVRAMRPSMLIVITTGYASDGLRDRFKGDNRLRFLGKPYEVEKLRSMLAELDALVTAAEPVKSRIWPPVWLPSFRKANMAKPASADAGGAGQWRRN